MEQYDFYDTAFVTIKHRNTPLALSGKDLLEVPSVTGDKLERKAAERVGNLSSRTAKEDTNR